MEKENSKLQSQTCSLPAADGGTKLGVLPVLSGMSVKRLVLLGNSDVCPGSQQMQRDHL